jgi:hypothetical protein
MFQILEAGTSVFEVFLVHILFQNWFGLREKSTIKSVLLAIAYLFLNLSYTFLDIAPLVRTGMAVVCVAVYAYFQYDTSKFSAFYGALTYMVITVLAEYVTMVVMNQLSYDTELLMTFGKERAVYIAFAKLINLLCIIIAAVLLGRNRGPMKVQQILPLIPCQLISMYICQMCYEISWDGNGFSGKFLLVLLGLLYINAMVIVFIQAIAAHAESLRQRELEEQNFKLQREYYMQVQKDQAETHALWHDIQKYVLAMQAAASAGSEATQREFQILRQEFQKIGTIVDVENQELNVILNHCVQKASAAGIKVNLDVSVPPALPVSAVDLSIIIGNTVDNAIAACQSLSGADSRINIMLRKNHDMLFYEIDNPYTPSAPAKKEKGHGYGLKNVQRCVEKYHGSFASAQTDGIYRVSICLNIGVEP